MNNRAVGPKAKVFSMLNGLRRRIILGVVAMSRAMRGETSTRRLIVKGLRVGERFNREGGVRIDASHCYLIRIGSDVTLAPNVHILAHDASLKRHLGIVRIGGVSIGNEVFIGAGSIVMPGVNIADRVIVGAGSVVTKDLEQSGIYAGNPARRIMDLDDFIAREQAKFSERPVLSAAHFSALSDLGTRTFVQETVGTGLAYQVSVDLAHLGLSQDIVDSLRAKQI